MTIPGLATATSRSLDVLAMGGLCLEEVVRLPRWPQGGHQQAHIERLDVTPGGAAPNVAVMTARLGGTSALLSTVGDDERGALLLAALRREGVDTGSCRIVSGHASAYQIVLTVGDDWWTAVLADRALDLRPDDVDTALVQRARILHIDGYAMFEPPGKVTVARAIAAARASGTLVSIDASTRLATEQAAYLASLMSSADIAFGNLAEWQLITGRESESGVVDALQAFGAHLAILKLGGRGALAVAGARSWVTPAFPVEVVDTVGAGDALVAGVLVGLCRGESIEAALRRGAAAGALACSGPGSLGSHFGPGDVDRLTAVSAA